MKEAIGKLVDELLSFFKENYKKPKLWIGLSIFILVFVLIFPYIDSNFFYYSRMEKRISILESVMELDEAKIDSNQAYRNEYQSILQEMEQQSERSVNSVINKATMYIDSVLTEGKRQGNRWIKFFTGAIWFFIVTILIPFMNTFRKPSDKVLAFVLMLILSLLVGWFFSVIPVLINPLVNYIGAPILQIVLFTVMVGKSNKKGKEDQT